MVAEKNLSANTLQNFAKFKVISENKNDKPWKNYIGKVPVPLLFARCILVIGSTLFEIRSISGSGR